MSHTYKIKYAIDSEVGQFQKEDAGEKGLTDALLVFSLLYPEDGIYNQRHFSIDGRTGKELTDNDLFKVWLLLAKRLGDSTSLSEEKRSLSRNAFNVFWLAADNPVNNPTNS